MYINEAFWDTPMVHSLCTFVMHELHPHESVSGSIMRTNRLRRRELNNMVTVNSTLQISQDGQSSSLL